MYVRAPLVAFEDLSLEEQLIKKEVIDLKIPKVVTKEPEELLADLTNYEEWRDRFAREISELSRHVYLAKFCSFFIQSAFDGPIDSSQLEKVVGRSFQPFFTTIYLALFGKLVVDMSRMWKDESSGSYPLDKWSEELVADTKPAYHDTIAEVRNRIHSNSGSISNISTEFRDARNEGYAHIASEADYRLVYKVSKVERYYNYLATYFNIFSFGAFTYMFRNDQDLYQIANSAWGPAIVAMLGRSELFEVYTNEPERFESDIKPTLNETEIKILEVMSDQGLVERLDWS